MYVVSSQKIKKQNFSVYLIQEIFQLISQIFLVFYKNVQVSLYIE